MSKNEELKPPSILAEDMVSAAKAVKEKLESVDAHLAVSAGAGDSDNNLDSGEDKAVKFDGALKEWAFNTIAKNTASIFQETMKEEQSKRRWRNFFICLFLILLVASLTLFIIGVALDATTDWFNLSIEVIIGAFAYFLTNIFAIIRLLSKYVSNSQYLKIFETLSTGLIDYLTKSGREAAKSHSE